TDIDTCRLMHKLRDINNRKIIDLEVLKEDGEIYPEAIRRLMERFADITLGSLLDIKSIRTASTNYDLAKKFIRNYKGTPDERFTKFIISTTPEIYDFNEEMIKKCNNHNEVSFERKMALEFGAEYLATLSDIEILNLLSEQGLITNEQRASLTRTYKSIGREGLIKEHARMDEWKKISAMQAESTEKMTNKPNPVGGGLTEREDR
ncbi:MAG: hypothetical protein K2H53_01430, partial [Clostridia bacterium]|nr:hypothetical protein [Clostridia bacterium]